MPSPIRSTHSAREEPVTITLSPTPSVSPTLTVSPNEVGQAYLSVYHGLHRLVDATMTASGLSLSRAKVLKQLHEFGPMNQSALAGRLGFAPRSVTDAIESLVREHLATRIEDPDDRRARIVTITRTGTEALQRAMAARDQLFEKIFGVLDAPARAEFVSQLNTIGRSLVPSGESLVQ